MLTNDAIEIFLNSQRSRSSSDNTIIGYAWALDKIAEKYPDELSETPEEMEALIAAQSGLAPESVRSLWQRLNTFWRWLHNRGYTANAMSGVTAPQQRKRFPRTLSVSEVKTLLSHVTHPRDYALMMVLLDTGMRVGELESMRKSKISPLGINVSGKNGDRLVPMTQKVRLLAMEQGDDEYFWVGKKGPLTRSGLQQIVKRQMKGAGLEPPKLGPHVLRHTFGMQYVRRGGDLFSLQTMLGHSNINATKVYVAMSHELVLAQLEKFSPAHEYYGIQPASQRSSLRSLTEGTAYGDSLLSAPRQGADAPARPESEASGQSASDLPSRLLNIRL